MLKTKVPIRGLAPFLWAVLAAPLMTGRTIPPARHILDHGAIIRADTGTRKMALVFTGHEFSDGGEFIRNVLKGQKVRASFFFTGDFYREPANAALVSRLAEDGHYLGPHSDKHLLYCSWHKREELLVSREEFAGDIKRNYRAMQKFGIAGRQAPFFIPPYEWYNTTIAGWAKDMGLVLINFTPGTASNADYTTPGMLNYRTSEEIFKSIIDYESSDPHGLNGFILLLHIGTHPDRKDKFYRRLGELLDVLKGRGYTFVRVDDLLRQPE
jgi:peptidoglycan/xylan/chitin deacetylase (PgdA/CDA1 family)